MYDEDDIQFVKDMEKLFTEDFAQFMLEMGAPDTPAVRMHWYEGLLISAREDPCDDYIIQKLCETLIENHILEAKLANAIEAAARASRTTVISLN